MRPLPPIVIHTLQMQCMGDGDVTQLNGHEHRLESTNHTTYLEI